MGKVSVIRKARGKGEGTSGVDALVGQRLRELRMLAGLSQTDLAAAIGLTFQQLQKYERGINRISASRLYLLARHLGVPVTALFSDVDGARGRGAQVVVANGNEAGGDHLRSREALILARHFMRIRDPAARAALKSFAEACASGGGIDGSLDTDGNLDTDDDTEIDRGVSDVLAASSGARRKRRPRGATWHPSDIGRN
jgi:transcriptional regulator with XRE-family HTH domain